MAWPSIYSDGNGSTSLGFNLRLVQPNASGGRSTSSSSTTIRPKIGDYPFLIWKGVMHPPRVLHAMAHKFGGVGHMTEDYGMVARPSRIMVTGWARDQRTAFEVEDNVPKMEGGFYPCIDGLGRNWENVLVSEAVCRECKALSSNARSIGSNGNLVRVTHRLTFEFTLYAQPKSIDV